MLARPSLRVHEVIFGAFLAITAGRLWAAGGAGSLGLSFAGMAGVLVAGAQLAARWPTVAMERVRLALLPVLVNTAYPQLGAVMQHLGGKSWDARLLQSDRALLGETPAVLLGAWTGPVLTEFLSACYLLFFFGVLAAFGVAVRRPVPQGARLFNGLISVYGLGFLGYTLVPAAGPHLAMPEVFAVPLTGGWITRANAALVAGGSNGVDVFPSLHVAVTAFLMGSLWRGRRRLFWALLLPAAGLGVATLYLRYHDAIDVLAGLLLAGIGLALTYFPKTYETNPPLP